MQSTSLKAVSLGKVAHELVTSCPRVVVAARAAGIEPVLVLDRVPYYRPDDVERIGEQLRQATRLKARGYMRFRTLDPS
jgi:hypothetical protein